MFVWLIMGDFFLLVRMWILYGDYLVLSFEVFLFFIICLNRFGFESFCGIEEKEVWADLGGLF